MGSGNLLKKIAGLKRGQKASPKKFKCPDSCISNGTSGNNPGTNGISDENFAATKIQTAFRAYKARKALRRLKGIVRAKAIAEKYSVKKQAEATLSYIHSWSHVQAQIRARRLCMVTEGRLKQKKLENQQKLETKLHDIECPDSCISNGTSGNNPGTNGISDENFAATKIQTAFRAYKARKALRRLKGIVRAKAMAEKYSVKKQAEATLSYIHSWSHVQAQIRARRLCMVTEGRLKQKKLENQQKLETKLHDIEVEWCGGSETKEETLAKIHQREEAAVKRERAMAYAFSHQWRADSKNQRLENYELCKSNWGWSWKDRWISAQPWEIRHNQSLSPKKPRSRKNGTFTNFPVKKTTVLTEPSVSDGGNAKKMKPRRLSFPGAKKPTACHLQVVS